MNNQDNKTSSMRNGVPPPPVLPRPQRAGMAASASRAAASIAEPFGGSLFRSVSMAAPVHSSVIGGGPSLRGMPGHTNSMPAAIQSLGPTRTMKMPPPMKLQPIKAGGLSRSTNRASAVPASLVTTRATPYEWKLDSMPPSIPMYHPVDLRTSLRLEDGAVTLDAVHSTTARLSKFLHRHSIHTQYSSKDNNENPFEEDLVRVTCMTPNMTQFCIQLWTLPEQSSTLIVEMQRRQGCCMEHQRIRRSLYKLLQLGDDEEEKDQVAPLGATEQDSLLNKVCDNAVNSSKALPGKLPPPLPRSFAFGKKIPAIPQGMTFGNFEPKRTEEQEQTQAIDTCRNLLTASNRRDQHELGLESLLSLCHPQKVSASLAERVCRAVICPKDNDTAIHDAVLQYCKNIQRPGDSSDEGESKEDVDADDMGWFGGYAAGRHYRTMHLMALRILSQALGVVTSASGSSKMALEASFVETLTVACTYNLSIAKFRPMEAELSARCLRVLLEQYYNPAESASSILTPPPATCVFDAHMHGQQFHAGLHRESGLLMQLQERFPVHA